MHAWKSFIHLYVCSQIKFEINRGSYISAHVCIIEFIKQVEENW